MSDIKCGYCQKLLSHSGNMYSKIIYWCIECLTEKRKELQAKGLQGLDVLDRKHPGSMLSYLNKNNVDILLSMGRKRLSDNFCCICNIISPHTTQNNQYICSFCLFLREIENGKV